MSDTAEHWFHGVFGSFGAWFFSMHLLVYTVQIPYDKLFSGIISIVAGLMTGLLSKLLNKYFVNKAKDELLSEQNCTIINLTNQLYQAQKEGLNSISPQTEQYPNNNNKITSQQTQK